MEKQKRPGGRPPLSSEVFDVQVRMPADLVARIDYFASSTGDTRSAAIRRALGWVLPQIGRPDIAA